MADKRRMHGSPGAGNRASRDRSGERDDERICSFNRQLAASLPKPPWLSMGDLKRHFGISRFRFCKPSVFAQRFRMRSFCTIV